MACIDCARLGRLEALNCQHVAVERPEAKLRARLHAAASQVSDELATIYRQSEERAAKRGGNKKERFNLNVVWPTKKDSVK